MPRGLPQSLGKPESELQPLALQCTVEYLFQYQTIEEACQSLLNSHVDMVGFDMEWWTQFKTGVAPREVALIQLCYDVPQQENMPKVAREHAIAGARSMQTQQAAEDDKQQLVSAPEPPSKRSCLASGAGKPTVVRSQPQRPRSHCLLLHISRTGVPPALREVLQTERIAKAGVGIHGDAEKLSLDHSVRLRGTLDIGAELNGRVQPGGCELVERTSFTLADAAARLLRAALPKPQRLRCSNWEAAPLSGEQRRYAALDALASLRCAQAALQLPLRTRGPLLEAGPPPWQLSQEAGGA